MRLSTLALCALFLFPRAVHAEVSITEIMYDVPGSDVNAEWIEILNQSNSPIDLSEWRFLEGGVHHMLKPESVSVIEPFRYAVIARNATSFREAWPSFSGILFMSSFSLNNSGETLSLVDQGGAIVESTTYSHAFGNGDGNTVNFTVQGEVSRSPSPGEPASPAAAVFIGQTLENRNFGNHEETPRVDTHEAIDENGVGDGVYAVSYMEEGGEKKQTLLPWLAALAAVIAVGFFAIFNRNSQAKSGYTIIEDNS